MVRVKMKSGQLYQITYGSSVDGGVTEIVVGDNGGELVISRGASEVKIKRIVVDAAEDVKLVDEYEPPLQKKKRF